MKIIKLRNGGIIAEAEKENDFKEFYEEFKKWLRKKYKKIK